MHGECSIGPGSMGRTVPGVAQLSNLAGYVRGGFFWRFCAVTKSLLPTTLNVICSIALIHKAGNPPVKNTPKCHVRIERAKRTAAYVHLRRCSWKRGAASATALLLRCWPLKKTTEQKQNPHRTQREGEMSLLLSRPPGREGFIA